MANEAVYVVADTSAEPLERTTLEAEKLLERRHLQEWVLKHPSILGEDLLVVTDEFDRWEDFGGNALADRLDVLALDNDGRPVVVELKRGTAPRLTDLQAVQYAAMVSRFSVHDLKDAHLAFLARRGQAGTADEVEARFEAHTGGKLSEQQLRSPRIILVAEEFGPALTASVVWLSEQGVDFSLRQLQLYRSAAGLMLTTSQIYPVRDVEEFTVRPRRREANAIREQAARPNLPWHQDDLAALVEKLEGRTQQPTVEAMLDLAAASPDRRLTWGRLVAAITRSATEAQSDLAQLTVIVRRELGRNNWPVNVTRINGEICYEMDPEVAAAWQQLRSR